MTTKPTKSTLKPSLWIEADAADNDWLGDTARKLAWPSALAEAIAKLTVKLSSTIAYLDEQAAAAHPMATRLEDDELHPDQVPQEFMRDAHPSSPASSPVEEVRNPAEPAREPGRTQEAIATRYAAGDTIGDMANDYNMRSDLVQRGLLESISDKLARPSFVAGYDHAQVFLFCGGGRRDGYGSE